MEERIKHLFRKYLDNSCTKEEFNEVFSYLHKGERELVIENAVEEAYREEIQPVPKKRYLRPYYSIAAAILIIFISGAAWFIINNNKTETLVAQDMLAKKTVTKITERSEYKYLLLPDSTQVWLNAESTLEFPENFNKTKREVYLQGEAYFDVKHADKIPFIIYTGDVSTEVLGTAFNIKAYPGLEKIVVSVKRGKVKVNYVNKQVALLTKGQQVSITNKDKKIKEKLIKEEETTAWHDGNLMYDDYSMSDIISDLERIYDVKISIASKEIGQLRVTTSFKREFGVENALEILCHLTDTRLNQENGIYNINNHTKN